MLLKPVHLTKLAIHALVIAFLLRSLKAILTIHIILIVIQHYCQLLITVYSLYEIRHMCSITQSLVKDNTKSVDSEISIVN